jgi:hypothetical protein
MFIKIINNAVTKQINKMHVLKMFNLNETKIVLQLFSFFKAQNSNKFHYLLFMMMIIHSPSSSWFYYYWFYYYYYYYTF